MMDATGRSHGRDQSGRDGHGVQQDVWLGAIPGGCPAPLRSPCPALRRLARGNPWRLPCPPAMTLPNAFIFAIHAWR
ncbi:MAG TPA: hypothetical protein VKY19_16490 [Ktedonosporobacter sp.]|nr:hypothetical protein [Ktedonosporobacter sp.]